MSPDRDAITDTAFVTGVHRMLGEEAWPYVGLWFKRLCAERILEAADERGREEVAAQWRGAQAFCLALENLVAGNVELIDGRRQRHYKAGTKTGSGAAAGARGR
jgi:hypothetical protein